MSTFLKWFIQYFSKIVERIFQCVFVNNNNNNKLPQTSSIAAFPKAPSKFFGLSCTIVNTVLPEVP